MSILKIEVERKGFCYEARCEENILVMNPHNGMDDMQNALHVAMKLAQSMDARGQWRFGHAQDNYYIFYCKEEI